MASEDKTLNLTQLIDDAAAIEEENRAVTVTSPQQVDRDFLDHYHKIGNRCNGSLLCQPENYALDKRCEQERRARLSEGEILRSDAELEASNKLPRSRNSPKAKGSSRALECDDEVGPAQKAGHTAKPRQLGETMDWKSFMNNKLEEEVDIAKRTKVILDSIGAKAAFKFRNLRDAFRLVDVDKGGTVSKDEMRDFFRQFNMPAADADLLFDSLDYDGSGELDYVEFMEHFGPVIQPGSAFRSRDDRQKLEGSPVYDNNVVGNSLRKLG